MTEKDFVLILHKKLIFIVFNGYMFGFVYEFIEYLHLVWIIFFDLKAANPISFAKAKKGHRFKTN